MSVLAERVLLSRSGITRLVDRLVADGMVERSACTTDARGAEAALTPAGLDRLRAASRTHLDGVPGYFLDVVAPEDRAAIAAGLEAVVDELDADGPPDVEADLPSAARRRPDDRRAPSARAGPRRHERLRVRGLGAAVLPGRRSGTRTCSPTTPRACPPAS